MRSSRRRVAPRRFYGVGPSGRKRLQIEGETAQIVAGLGAGLHETRKPLRLNMPATGYIVVALHSQRGALDAHAFQAIAAASLLAAPDQAVLVLVFGLLADDITPYGADFIAVFPELGSEVWQPALKLAYLEDFVTHYSPRHIILPDNQIGDGDLGRRLAVGLDADCAAHVVELSRQQLAMYWQGGAQLARGPLARVLLIAPDIVETNLPFRGVGERVETLSLTVASEPYQDFGVHEMPASHLALEEADFIVAAGNGVEDVKRFKQLAEQFGAATAASRVAVDDGKFTRDKQVGATGKTVSASLYMAIGISGAVQHLQGIKACRHVIAINKDASAPIVKRANLTVVGDAQEIMSALLDAQQKPHFPQETQE